MFFFFIIFFFYETFLLLFLTKFLYEIANVSFYFIMYTDILHIIRILSMTHSSVYVNSFGLCFFFIIYIHCCNLFSNADCYYYHYFAFNVSEQ